MVEQAQRHVKLVSLRVAYRSATVAEFIVKHALDVGRNGIYIKTPQPFPIGTLLRLQVQLADGHVVIAAIGSVAWTRDAIGERALRPAGMGVRFVKTDEASRKLIDALAGTRADAGFAYEDGFGPPSSSVPSAQPTSMFPASAGSAPTTDEPTVVTRIEDMIDEIIAPRTRVHRATLMGIGSLPPVVAPPPQTTSSTPPLRPREPSHSDDPTLIEQVDELLEESLRDAAPSFVDMTTPVIISDFPLSAPAPTAKPVARRSAKRRATTGIREAIGVVAVVALALTMAGNRGRRRATGPDSRRPVAIEATAQAPPAPKVSPPPAPPAAPPEAAALSPVPAPAAPPESVIADASSQVAARKPAPVGPRAAGVRKKAPVTTTAPIAPPKPKWLPKPEKVDNPY